MRKAGIGRFLAKRAGLAAITLVIVSITIFSVAQVLPGDVGRTVLGPTASNQQVAALDHKLGLDRPLPVRYGDWIGNFVTGNWGRSLVFDVSARSLVLERLKNSLMLAGFALLIVVPVSIALGVVAALHAGRFLDRFISITGLSLIGLPEFVTGIVLLVVFAVQLGWFPVSSHVPKADPVDVVRQFMLPALPLVLVLFGYIMRMARAGTVDALAANYTRTALLKGLPRRTVIRRHVLRNALLPTIGVISVQIGYMVGGLVVIETLFNYPGIGNLILNSATGHDLPVLEASVLMIALLYMVSNLVADLLYALLNPRIRLGS